jgi:hypothetical protein
MLSGGAFRSSWCPANKRPRWRFAPPNPTNLSDFMVSGYSIVPGRPPAHGRTITAETPTDKQRTDHARQPPCVKSATGIASAGIACRHNMKANEPGPTATQHRPQHRPIAPVRAAPGVAVAIRNGGQPRWRAPPKTTYRCAIRRRSIHPPQTHRSRLLVGAGKRSSGRLEGNSRNLRTKPGATAEMGLTRRIGVPGVPATS